MRKKSHHDDMLDAISYVAPDGWFQPWRIVQSKIDRKLAIANLNMKMYIHQRWWKAKQKLGIAA